MPNFSASFCFCLFFFVFFFFILEMRGALANVLRGEEDDEEQRVSRGDTERDLGHDVIVREEMFAQTVTAEQYNEDAVHSVVQILCTNDGVYSRDTNHKLADQH